MASFTWRAFFEKLNPVAIFLAAIAGYFGIFPKLIFLGIIIWQLVTKGKTLWGALVSFVNTIAGWIKKKKPTQEPQQKETFKKPTKSQRKPK